MATNHSKTLGNGSKVINTSIKGRNKKRRKIRTKNREQKRKRENLKMKNLKESR